MLKWKRLAPGVYRAYIMQGFYDALYTPHRRYPWHSFYVGYMGGAVFLGTHRTKKEAQRAAEEHTRRSPC